MYCHKEIQHFPHTLYASNINNLFKIREHIFPIRQMSLYFLKQKEKKIPHFFHCNNNEFFWTNKCIFTFQILVILTCIEAKCQAVSSKYIF